MSAAGTGPGALVVTHRGSVDAWDCDENDHLNMRFYLAKANEGLPFLLRDLGLDHRALRALGARPRVVSQHVRYLKEALAGTPLTVFAGVAAAARDRLTTYAEVRHSATGEVHATLLTGVALVSGGGATVAIPVAAPPRLCAVPPHGAPRGVTDAEPPLRPSHADLGALGFVEIGRGTIGAQECDEHGDLLEHQVAGRVSDSVVNLMVHYQTPEELARRTGGEEGGALLELRMVHHAPLRAGTPFTIHSGLRAVTRKVLRVVHLVYDEVSGACATSCDGVAIAMDLRARRAMELPEARRRRMEERLLRLPPEVAGAGPPRSKS